MQDLIRKIKKELKELGDQGITSSNIQLLEKLSISLKNLQESQEEEGEMRMRDYRDGGYGDYERGYRDRGGYRNGGYGEYRDGRGGGYGRPYMDGGGYGHLDPRMREHIEHICDGIEMYEYGRDRYQHGGTEEKMIDGLEKIMYAVCMLVETASDAAQTPQEKEVIRKHLQKIRNV